MKRSIGFGLVALVFVAGVIMAGDEVTLEGEFLWNAGGGDTRGDLRAVFSPTGENEWSLRLSDDGPTAPVCKDGVCVFNTWSCTMFGIDAETADRMFGWFLRALRFGPPPHAGFAFGIDRLVMVLRNVESIREVIPFPKTQSGVDPLTGSPSIVEDGQLAELGITLRPETRTKLEES